jgi:hypothetical protein
MIRTNNIIQNSILIIILFSFKIVTASSPQFPDYLIFKNDTIPVYNLILEKYLDQQNKSDHGTLFGLKLREGASFNCWRGYQAIYSIENDSLFLKDIIDCGELSSSKSIDKVESIGKMKALFQNKSVNGKVFIEWYSGKISLPNGKLLRWDGVFHKTFENEILFKVEKGIISKISKIENYVDDSNRIDRRYNDTISNIIFEELKSHYKSEKEPIDCSERFTATINKKGKISEISMTDYSQKEIKEYFVKEEYENCIRTIRKYLESLQFDIIANQGKPIEEKVTFEIWLNEDGSLENWTY